MSAHGDDLVEIRDRQRAFVQVRLHPLRRLAANVHGVHLARTLGFYVVLSRQIGDHTRRSRGATPYRAFRQDLAATAEISLKALRQHVTRLTECGAIAVVDRTGPNGREPSEWELRGRRAPFVPLQVDALDAISATVPTRSTLLSHLGLYLALFDLANDDGYGARALQRPVSDISKRCGLGLTQLREQARTLVRAGVLEIHNRTNDRRANIAQLWDLIDPPSPGSVSAGTPARNGTHPGSVSAGTPARNGTHPGSVSAGTPARNGTHPGSVSAGTPARNGTHPGSEGGVQAAPIRAGDHARTDALNARATRTFEDVPLETDSFYPSSSVTEEVDALCQLMSDRVVERAGSPGVLRRPDSWPNNSAAWRAAAERILDAYTPDDVRRAIEYLHRSDYYGRRCRTMDHLDRDIDELVIGARAAHSTHGTAPSWDAAWARIVAAVQLFGSTRSGDARRDLESEHPALRAFVDRIGWSAICNADPSYIPGAWKREYSECTKNSAQEGAA